MVIVVSAFRLFEVQSRRPPTLSVQFRLQTSWCYCVAPARRDDVAEKNDMKRSFSSKWNGELLSARPLIDCRAISALIGSFFPTLRIWASVRVSA